MKKLQLLLAAASLFLLSSTGLGSSAQAAEKKDQVFKPASGGYTLTVPPGSQEIYHTTTGIRFTVGKTFLVSADLYTLPNFVSVPMRQYSSEQQKEFTSFIGKVQDMQDSTIVEDGVKGSTGQSAAADRLRAVLRRVNNPELMRAREDEKSGYDRDTFTYEAIPKDSLKTRRPFTVGKVYQPQKNIALVVNVSAPQDQEAAAREALKALTKDLSLAKVRYTDINLLTVPSMGFEMEIPSGWRMYTLRADNILFGRSLSSVHTDDLMIRRFSDPSFAELGTATPANLKQAESNFLDKVTRYTPNVTILRHEPITVGTLNGSLAESTDNEDLKKVFIINTYLMNRQGSGFQIRYETDDTINYDLKLNAFKQSIESFTLLPDAQNRAPQQ
ncbi:hypothetical protein LQE88_06115 [Acidaminococcus sp. NSJ-142]|jgi:hypothetical protein|uniref:hypothetical protein n=1 Tax=Acidaminococcus TaxID=904 RepID=UPI000CF862A5|nr:MULTISPECIES: hypothetical protein [Acidaminococcus]MCD2435563.1 hypothetical protein [Acidaminococcus hominis]MCH4095643.1 hypothetical protein [Acidaminococcus provencensis]RHK01429.1 hypothetical protein DW089_06905 [Acidaminococcus sp. AM05-11]